MGDIVIEETNYKAFFTLLVNILFLAGSISDMYYGFGISKISYWLPGLIASLILFTWFIRSFIRAMKVKKLLTITREGIIDNSSIGGVGFISFDDIKEFSILTLYNKKVIAVTPKNIEELLAKLSLVKRRFIRRNLNLNLPPITINVSRAKDMEPEDILSLLRKRLSDISSLED